MKYFLVLFVVLIDILLSGLLFGIAQDVVNSSAPTHLIMGIAAVCLLGFACIAIISLHAIRHILKT